MTRGEPLGGKVPTPRTDVYQLGVTLYEMIAEIERALGKKAAIDRQPLQPGDVPRTYADVEKARRLLGYEPRTPFREGIDRFVAWYRETVAAPTAAGGKR